eukprot:TRINITY_DN2659_c0_g2_i1.p1 TRINITY_DN2659_c0_g2~~TRINITY_DN2659_c0_g2_i1.p1  ORF type:complete len:305 (+),score=94.23 TRINITY_DN2659_c0_g2_i1:133-1047(+)
MYYRSASLALLICAFAAVVQSAPYVRFINGYMASEVVTLQSDLLPDFTLAYGEVTEYQLVTGGRLEVTISSNLTGAFYNTSLLVIFNSYTTVAVAMDNTNKINLVFFNDTEAATMIQNYLQPGDNDTVGPNRAWIRLASYVAGNQQISLFKNSAGSASMFSNVAYSQVTQFVEVVPSAVTSVLVKRGTSTVTSPVSLERNTAYTVFAFGGASGNVIVNVIADRAVPWTEQPTSTSTGNSAASTGTDVSTGVSTSGNEQTSTSGNNSNGGNSGPNGQDSQENDDSASSVIRFASAVAAAAAILAF